MRLVAAGHRSEVLSVVTAAKFLLSVCDQLLLFQPLSLFPLLSLSELSRCSSVVTVRG